MKTNKNDYAFPHALGDITTYQHIDCGLTKREYFAAIAMQGLVTYVDLSVEKTAEISVRQADALINELNKDKKDE